MKWIEDSRSDEHSSCMFVLGETRSGSLLENIANK